MNRTVLAVDGNDVGARHCTQRLDDGSGCDQALFVGERESLTRAQRRDGDGKTGETDDTIDDDIGALDERDGFGDDGDTRQLRGNLGARYVIRYDDDLRLPLLGLRNDAIHRRPDAECDDFDTLTE